MERDFMGLAMKQETSDETIDAVPLRSSAMQWSFSSQGQVLSFQGSAQEDNRPKTGFESLASTGLVTLTTREALESDHKSYPSAPQKNIVHEKQGGVGYMMNRPSISQTNLRLSPMTAAMNHQSYVATAVSSQPLTGVPMANPVPAMPSSNSPVVGTTDLRNTPKIAGAPAQLTIFYNGSVCVYDNISPEKAQAIMLLAGNGPPMNSSPSPPPAPLQAKVPRSSFLDGLIVSQPYGKTPQRCNPVPITSISVAHSAKPAIVPVSSPNIVAPQNVVNPLGSVSTTFLSSDTVPQFRRKSLARFLEKRKERVISVSPYGDKQTPECSTPGAAGRRSLSMNSSGSCPVPAIN